MIHLRIRTEYTFGQTYAPLPRIIERLQAIGCTAAGIVDTGTWGHAKWKAACEAAGIQPLFGVEVVVSDDETPTRMWFLAKTTEGLSELYTAMSMAHRQPLSTRGGALPRLYLHDVESMTTDIVKFAGDLTDGAWLKKIGAVLDLSPASRILNAAKLQVATKHKLKVVSTADNAFAFPEDRATYEVMGRVSLKPTPQYLLDLLAHQDMAASIAMECHKCKMPTAKMIRAKGSLALLCEQGKRARGFTKKTWSRIYETRLQYELGLIEQKDFASYFLIVADMVVYAKQHMLVGPSRGSAAGSLVCYLTRITEIDPIKHTLMFERFIDETRTDLPDIDLDFPDDKRHLVFEYMAKQYGAENVAHIGTVSRFKPKSALIQVCKALNIPPEATGAVKASLIDRSSADARASNCLEDTFTTTKPGKDFVRIYPEAAVASKLEAHASHTGTHAAGLLVCNEPITKFCTVDAEGIAQLEKDAAEKLGLLKIDILGLRTLSILEDAGKKIDWYSLPLDDQKTIDLFNTGRLCGIFQFEGDAMRSISTQLKIHSIIEIDAVTALARPGPFAGGVTKKYIDRMNGTSYASIHPKVETHMSETFGLPIYQEQTLIIVKEIGGFGGKESAMIRKAISKSMGVEFFNSYWERFKAGAATHGVEEGEAKSVWQLIMTMGSWQMNKCTAEGTLVRITANNAGLPLWCPIELLYEKYVAEPSKWVKQNKSMPRLLSLFPDGRGRPQRAKMIHFNGVKSCVELSFDDGTTIRCTRDHKFIIDSEWRECGTAKRGAQFVTLQRDTEHTNIGTPIGAHSGRTVAMQTFRATHTGQPCEECGEKKRRREIHHNDFCKGARRPADLAWLCSSCHKLRHKAYGDRGVPFDRGHEVTWKTLLSIKPAGKCKTYDIEMPTHHNYVVDGGLVTHNSHTRSYAVISYWCAYLKAHYPLDFAAANLRNAKDEDNAVLLLREMTREGIEYVPFDLDKSEINWSVKDGKLYGGFLTHKGIGESKAQKLIAARDNGTLTTSQRETISKSFNIFADLFPLQTKHRALYAEPEANGIQGPISYIQDLLTPLPHGAERVFIAEMIAKSPRNANEEANIKKRDGVIATGQLEYLDVRLRDDTGTIGGRIGVRDYLQIGVELAESVPTGAVLLIRARFWNGITYAFISKWRRLDG